MSLDTEVTSLAISPDGSRFASGFANGILLVHILEQQTGRILLEQILVASQGPIDSLSFDEGDPSGHWLASASRDGEVLVWNLTDTPTPQRLGATGSVLYHLHLDIARGRLVSGGGIGDVRVWSLSEETSDPPAPLPIHDCTILSMQLDGERLYVSDAEHHLIAWDLTSDPPEPSILTRASKIWHTALSPDRTTLATIDEAGEITLWNFGANEPTHEVIGQQDGVYFGFSPIFAFDDEGRRLLAGGGAGETSVWNLGTGTPIVSEVGLPEIRLSPYRRNAMLAIAGEHLAMVPAARPEAALLFDATVLSELREVESDKDGSIRYVTFGDGGGWLRWHTVMALR